MKVKTDYTECDYITAGKEYEVTNNTCRWFDGSILDDDGDRIYIFLKKSAFIGHQDWEIIK